MIQTQRFVSSHNRFINCQKTEAFRCTKSIHLIRCHNNRCDKHIEKIFLYRPKASLFRFLHERHPRSNRINAPMTPIHTKPISIGSLLVVIICHIIIAAFPRQHNNRSSDDLSHICFFKHILRSDFYDFISFGFHAYGHQPYAFTESATSAASTQPSSRVPAKTAFLYNVHQSIAPLLGIAQQSSLYVFDSVFHAESNGAVFIFLSWTTKKSIRNPRSWDRGFSHAISKSSVSQPMVL